MQLALFLSDHIRQMQRKNFPDSKIAKFYHCRTKIVCILNYALANELIDAMKKEPYSPSIDTANDSKSIVTQKLFLNMFNIRY